MYVPLATSIVSPEEEAKIDSDMEQNGNAEVPSPTGDVGEQLRAST